MCFVFPLIVAIFLILDMARSTLFLTLLLVSALGYVLTMSPDGTESPFPGCLSWFKIQEGMTCQTMAHMCLITESGTFRNLRSRFFNSWDLKSESFWVFRLRICSNLGEAGDRLEVRRRGEYQSFVTSSRFRLVKMMKRGRVGYESNRVDY